MKEKQTAVIIDGKKYEYRTGKYNDATEACEVCALREQCKNSESDVLCSPLGKIQDSTGNFQLVGEDGEVTEPMVYDFYQKSAANAANRADQLAWMFIVMMTGGLISGHAFQTFSVCAALSAIYMLLSVMQSVWHVFTCWLFKRQLKKAEVMPNDYPVWVRASWLFFWLKMISISAAVCYFVNAIFF